MWQINEVLRFDGQHYRILAVNSGEIVWICLDLDTAQPERRTELGKVRISGEILLG